jgi:hypothetical protein
MDLACTACDAGCRVSRKHRHEPHRPRHRIHFHRHRIAEFGADSVRALGWVSEASQASRL